MSKNMTRKGLAFGAGLALLASGLAAAPASAGVDDNAVSLVPRTGTQYGMVTDGYFDLKSTQSTSAASSTGNISFLVTDPGSISKFDYQEGAPVSDDTQMASVAYNAGTTTWTLAYVASTDIVTITDATAADAEFTNAAAGDIVKLAGIKSAGMATAFTGWAEVISNTGDDVITFKIDGLKATDITTEAMTAGTIEESSDNDLLDDFGTISAGSLGVAGVTVLAVPTRAASGSYVVVGPDADSTQTDVLRLVASKAGSVTVQAWIDENGDGLIDTTEATSSARTVTFVTWANSGAALNIETPVAGADWEVYASFNATINASQIPATRLDVALGVLDAGVLESAEANTTASAGMFTAATTSLVWDDAVNHVDDYWGLQAQVSSNLAGVAATDFVAGYTYAGQIFLDGVAYGNIVYTGIGAAVADDLSNIFATKNDNVRQSGAAAVEVRPLYTGNVELKILLTEDDATIAGNPTGAGAGKVAVAAGTEVTVKVARGGGSLDADSTVTSGGKTLTSVSVPSSISYTAVTDANGYATVTLSNDEGVAGDDLDVTITHAGVAKTTSVIWTAAVAANSVLSGATVLSIEPKDTWTLQYTAVDEYGAALAGPAYRVVVTYYDTVGGTQKTTGVALDANGQGTLTVTDASLANGNFAVVGTLQKLGLDAVYADFGSPEVVNSTVYVVSDKDAGAITIVETITTAGAGDPALELVPAANVDATGPNGPTAPAVSAAEKTTISGVVTTASGAAVRGTAVTLSAPGLFFKNGDVYTVGSATVVTTNTGAYSVEVRSNVGGEHVLTATAGSATKTKSIGFDAALETKGTSLVIDAPTKAPAGTSYTVTVSLKDAFGNPVKTTTADKFTLSYKGSGIALSVPSDTDANGEASFAVLLGSNDTGVGTITATYNADSDLTTVDNNLTAVATVNGAAAAADQKVNAGSFKGYVALYAKGYAGKRMSAKVGKDWVVVESLASNFERVVEYTGAGYTVAVRIYIDRVLIDTITVTTK